MSDWDGPNPSDSGISRRAMLAGLGVAAVGGAGAVAVGAGGLDSVLGGSESIATFSGDKTANSTVDLDAGVPIRAVAEITGPTGSNSEIGIVIKHKDRFEALIEAFGTERAAGNAMTTFAGTHEILIAATAEFEATLSRRNTGLF